MAKLSNYKEQVTRSLGGTSDAVVRQTVLVGTGTTELFQLDSPGIYRIYLKNAGATATNACKIQCRNSSNGAWQDIVSTTTDFTTIPGAIANFLLASDDTIDPTALTAGQEWNGAIDSKSFAEVRMIATVASGSTAIDVEVS